MKLIRLLEQHRSAKAAGLPNNLGDGYLCEKNQIYGKMRAAALAAGYKFSDEANNGYQALPFAQLENILTTKTIPYTNNVLVVENLVAKLKDDVAWDDISDGLKKNYVFHESCHAVARTFAGPIANQDQKQKALRILMEESFANTAELVAVIDAEDAAHKIFFGQNSYTALFEERTNIRNAVKEHGFNNVFKTMFLAYLHSNYLHERIEEKAWNQCLQLANEGKASKALKALSRLAFTLDPRFREVTTKFHLKLNGLAVKMPELLSLDFLNEKDLRDFLIKIDRLLT